MLPRSPHLASLRRREWLGVAVLVLGGCGSSCGDSNNPGTIGELGNGRFEYVCTGPSDPVCEDEDMPGQFPECIALGGVFSLEYVLLDTSILDPSDDSPLIYVESVNQRFFQGEDSFQALRTGEAAFLVREDESVLDLIHLRIIEPDEIEVFDPTGDRAQSLELPPNDDIVLDVFPRSVSCSRLGGAIFVEAESSDAAVAEASSGQQVRITGVAEGDAVVRLFYGDLEVAIQVHVTEDIDPATSTGDSGTTGPDPSGTESGSSGSSTGDSTGGSDSGGSTGGSSSTGGAT